MSFLFRFFFQKAWMEGWEAGRYYERLALQKGIDTGPVYSQDREGRVLDV